jgi:hypothetical protein
MVGRWNVGLTAKNLSTNLIKPVPGIPRRTRLQKMEVH